MNLLTRIWRSSLGKKYVMAVTGIALFGFVIGHLVGNLQVFGNPDLINTYAHFLKSKPGLIWGARLGLLGVVGLHIAAAVTLSMANRAARPVAYAGGSAYGSAWRINSNDYGLEIFFFSKLFDSFNDGSRFKNHTCNIQNCNISSVWKKFIMIKRISKK
jgi:hypothetical protein